ncbi:HYR domain-containing protein, partial [Salegentibacter salarius]
MGKITPRFFLAVFIFGLCLLSANTVLANINFGPEKPISEKQIKDKSFFVGFLLEAAPTITAPADINDVNEPGECFALKTNINLGNATFSGTTNSPSNDAPAEFPVGTTTVTWTVTDDSGNTATDTQLVNITDSENPVVSTQNISISLNNGIATIQPSDINNGSYDNCGIDQLSLNKTSFTCSDVGANTVDLSVTDIHGNTSSANATVTVEDNTN